MRRCDDPGYAQPSLTAKKLRLLEVRAGSPSHRGVYTGTFATRQRMRAAVRELATQAESAYKLMVAEWQRTQAKRKKGAGATPGRASRGPSSGQAARQVQAPGPALQLVVRTGARFELSHSRWCVQASLDFHASSDPRVSWHSVETAAITSGLLGGVRR
jgi:hypothetical protein